MILLCVFLDLAFIIYKRPFFSKHLEGIIIWMNVFLIMIYSSCLPLRYNDTHGPTLFLILIFISLPISLKITRVIMLLYNNQINKKFEELMNTNSLSKLDNSSPYIDQILRMIVYPDEIYVNK